ncbi:MULTISPECIES: OsmC family protein [Burkholderia cepacia complex]|uniref:OsmC family protein n=1 Tax=Burkholderia cepacia complex TaxID=87882 RepID=UPI001CF5CE45|nr:MULTISPECIES: OsmC family protein [Burkholderia cepacia complex]MCA8057368.1 OsmC family protein [Burkholderia cepacia]MDN7535193.1 OsmC family protein [Burkholderia orbicola]
MAKANFDFVATWCGGVSGEGKIGARNFELGIAIPEAFGGSGEGASPKDLFAAATAACLLSTLRVISEKRALPVKGLSIKTSGESDEGGFHIKHDVDIELDGHATSQDVETTKQMITSADRSCTIGNMARKAGVLIEVQQNIKVMS